MRRTVVALLCLAGALVAPAGAAAFPDTRYENQCQYFDPFWRPVPLTFGGQLTNGSGTELLPGAQLSVGDTVRLTGGIVSASLPSWMPTFAYEAGMIPLGDGSLPVQGWLALEATNTVEGITTVPFDTVARTHVELAPGGIVDEERSYIRVDRASLAQQTWTATGGDVTVRQALAESLAPVPLDDGGTRRPWGSLFVDAELTFPSGEEFHLYMDCLPGKQVRDGETHTDELPPALGEFRVPGFSGAVAGVDLEDEVDADLLTSAGPPRTVAGAQAVLTSSAIRLRLNEAQRDAWFGDATSVAITGSVNLTGARSAEQTQAVTVDRTVSVAPTGAVTLTLPLPDTTWTATTGDGIDVAGDRRLTLSATAGGVTRQLVLSRVSPTGPYPFARILRAGAAPTPIVRNPPQDPPPFNPPPVVTPLPTVTPQPTPTPKAGKAGVASKSLKVKSNRVSASLSCTGQTTCRGTLKLRTAVKVKKKFVTLTKTVRYTVGAGKKKTVRLSLSKAGKQYLRGKKKRVSVVLQVKPASGKTVTKRLRLTR
jgi:hypothetical protein